jgi:hypothetical protein
MMYLAKFSIASWSPGRILGLQWTLKPTSGPYGSYVPEGMPPRQDELAHLFRDIEMQWLFLFSKDDILRCEEPVLNCAL